MPSTLKSSLKVSFVSLMLIFSQIEVSHAHHSPGYAYDGGVLTSHPRWMTALKDDVLLSELSIPGTHDTMSLHGLPVRDAMIAGAAAGGAAGSVTGVGAAGGAVVGGAIAPVISADAVRTQRLSLPDQLASGIRVLDIRCRHVGDIFNIYHGPVYQRANFDDVLKAVVEFLNKNPGETVLMRVKEEYEPTHNTRTFEQTFRLKYWESYKAHMWQGTSVNPTLGEMRGKIVILQDFARENCGHPDRCARTDKPIYGICYCTFSSQDVFKLKTNWDLYDKWLKVKAHLAAADSDSGDTKYINYLSAAEGAFPYFVASGHSSPATGAPRLATGRTTPGWKNSWPNFPRVNCALGICTIAFEGTNILTYGALGTYYKNRVGIIMADFPGPGLIDRTIALNHRFKK